MLVQNLDHFFTISTAAKQRLNQFPCRVQRMKEKKREKKRKGSKEGHNCQKTAAAAAAIKKESYKLKERKSYYVMQ